MLVPNIEQIKKRRLAFNLLRSQLSIKAGLPKNAISRIEKQETTVVQYLRAREIARALSCDLYDVFSEVEKRINIEN